MSLLTQPNELTNTQPISCMIYGQPGTGKTTLALSANKPVLIDLDRGLHRVEKRFQCPSLQVENYQQILDLLKSGELAPFDTIVIDTLGKLVDRMGDYVAVANPKFKQGDGTLSMKAWGAIKVQFSNLIKTIFNMNKSVIFVAHEKEDKDGDVRFVRPDVSGSSGKDIVKELDLMGYVEMKGNKRTVSFTPSEKFYAKNSLGLPSVIEIPDTKTGNTFFQDSIVKAVEEKRKADAELLELYNETKKKIDKTIAGIKNVGGLNKAYAELAMNKSDIIEKIKKLLEINRSNGATEAEEVAATERANVLMTKYQIEEHLLQGSIKTKNKKESQKNDDRSVAFSNLRAAIADFFGVLALYTSSDYSYYGRPEQVELSHEMTRRAVASLSLCYTNYICSEEYRKNRRTTGRNDIRLSFRDGFYERIASRLIKLVDERAKETARATGTNLVVLNSQNLENAFNEDFNVKLKTGRARKERDFDRAAYAAGIVEGGKFRILQEVNENKDKENDKIGTNL